MELVAPTVPLPSCCAIGDNTGIPVSLRLRS
jgi:hypothetical protein